MLHAAALTAGSPALAALPSRSSPWRTAEQRAQETADSAFYSLGSVLDETEEQPWEAQQAPGQYLPNRASRRTPRPAVALPALTRHQPAAPQPVPIIHSSAYQQALVQTRTLSPGPLNSDDEDAPPQQPQQPVRA